MLESDMGEMQDAPEEIPLLNGAARWASEDGKNKQGSESASQSDMRVIANRVFYEFAPFWYMTNQWHCKRLNVEDSQNVFVLKGPFSSKEMFTQYTSRRTMKGSNLIVGIASKSVIQKGVCIPATFFRTLGHIFELAKCGMCYKPLTVEDIKRGSLEPDLALQALPLWLVESSPIPPGTRESDAGSSSPGDLPSVDPQPASFADLKTEEVEQLRGGSAQLAAGLKQPSSNGKIRTFRDSVDVTASNNGGRLEAAEALLNTAPFWCYLYSHEVLHARKTPPKTSKEMLQLYKEGCLPDWTPVLGLLESVAMYNSIPPSLFLPISSLLDLEGLKSHDQGGMSTQYSPVGLEELSKWDKFRDKRSEKGHTTRLESAHALAASSSSGTLGMMSLPSRSLRRQHRSMTSLMPRGMTRSFSYANYPSNDMGGGVPAMPVVSGMRPLSMVAPVPSSSSIGMTLGGSLPVSPYQYSPSAMFYYVPASSVYAMHYPSDYSMNYQQPQQPFSPSYHPLQYRHSEPTLPVLPLVTSGMIATVAESDLEANISEGPNAADSPPPTTTAPVAPPPVSSSSKASAEVEAGNSSMGSAGIRSIIGSLVAGSVEVASSDSKWPASSSDDGPSMNSVIPSSPPSGLQDQQDGPSKKQ